MRSHDRNRGPKQVSAAVHAAAFQDHLMRDFLGLGVGGRRTSLGSIGKRVVEKTTSSKPSTPSYVKAENMDHHIYEKRLSIAQKWNLVEKPPPPPSTKEWDGITKTAERRKACSGPCPICHEEFVDRPQIILNCAHVFHESCFKSFERFSRSRCCPICRQKDYYCRRYDGGTIQWRETAAINVQRLFRGHIARYYIALSIRGELNSLNLSPSYAVTVPRISVPPSIGRRRWARRFVFNRLEKIREHKTSKSKKRIEMRQKKDDFDVVNFYQTSSSSFTSTDEFLYSLDATLRQSHETIKTSLAVFADSHPRAPTSMRPSSGTKLVEKEKHIYDLPKGLVPFDPKTIGKVNWMDALSKALARAAHDSECSICCEDCLTVGESGKEGEERVALLSCGHVFHEPCVASFEGFAVFKIPRCPVCRSCYEKSSYIHVFH